MSLSQLTSRIIKLLLQQPTNTEVSWGSILGLIRGCPGVKDVDGEGVESRPEEYPQSEAGDEETLIWRDETLDDSSE